jgi:methylated-DNA-[protein]-cysteine S-methyltransferase
MNLKVLEVESPIGAIVMVEAESRLCGLNFDDFGERMRQRLQDRYGDVRVQPVRSGHEFGRRMKDYLAGDLAALDGIPVDAGGTPFQRKVWRALRKIRPGQTRSYGELAAAIGQPKAMRAVGMANNRNPVGIVVPCHRVIGADGSLTGYGGGIERKRWLLEHEKVLL